MNFNIVLCIGDSITNGARDDKKSTYPLEMETILENSVGGMWICLNEGINGETTCDIVKRFYSLLKKYPEAQEVCFFEGVNDSKDNKNTPVDTFKKNLEHCIKASIVRQKKLFVGTIPYQKGILAPSYNKATNERVNLYNKEINRLCEKYSLPKVELSDLDETLYSDGIHLNNKGHIEIAKRFAQAILKERGHNNNSSTETVKDNNELANNSLSRS